MTLQSKLTEEEQQLLSAYGIKGKMQDNSILDYPEVEQWMKSKEGELFLSGEKGLVLHGGWKAAKVGYAIQRWFLLAGSTGAVVDLCEFEEYFNTPGFVEEKLTQINIFIENFADLGDCPLDHLEKWKVQNFVKEKYFGLGTITIQVHNVNEWYQLPFQEFINDCFLKLDLWDNCEQRL